MGRRLRKAAVPFLLALFGTAASTIGLAQTSYMLNNGKIRFGGGGHSTIDVTAASSPSGMLEQAFYNTANGTWYELTFSSIRLSMTLGSGTRNRHYWAGVDVTTPWIGSLVGWLGLLQPLGFPMDSSGFTSAARVAIVVVAHGVFGVTGTAGTDSGFLDPILTTFGVNTDRPDQKSCALHWLRLQVLCDAKRAGGNTGPGLTSLAHVTSINHNTGITFINSFSGFRSAS